MLENEEKEIIKRLEQLEITKRNLTTRLSQIREEKGLQYEGFEIGDRVKIQSKGKYKFREATVIGITRNKITIESDTGIVTWRAPKNLTVLHRQEQSDAGSE